MTDFRHSAGNPPQGANNRIALFGIAAVVALLHLLTNHRYGFHRDELQFLSDARHLDWGFVAYPPLTPFLERISLAAFGLSAGGLRLFSVLAQSLAIVVTGLMAEELGGGPLEQFAAALAVALSPLPLFEGTEFQYTSFDYLWWVLVAYFVVRLLKTENSRWWLAIGTATGLGLMTKYTIAFFVLSLVAGFSLTSHRRLLLNKWLIAGAGIAVLIFLPNFLWQVHHHFISYRFLQHIHARDVGLGRAHGFLWKQLVVCTNAYSVPLWVAGLVCFFRSERYRPLAWMYVFPAMFFYFAQGVFYYLAPAYPMLIAMGAVAGGEWVNQLSRVWQRVVKTLFFAGIAGAGAYGCALVLPLATHGPLMEFAVRNNDALREEFGWNELVATVSQIRDSLPPDRRFKAGVLVGNYGEQGAIEILGPAYGLPPPISMTNSAWLRGYPTPQPSTLIVVGFSREAAERAFTSCQFAGRNDNSLGLQNEESQSHPDIFVCVGPRMSWPEFWKAYQNFG